LILKSVYYEIYLKCLDQKRHPFNSRYSLLCGSLLADLDNKRHDTRADDLYLSTHSDDEPLPHFRDRHLCDDAKLIVVKKEAIVDIETGDNTVEVCEQVEIQKSNSG